MENGGNAKVNAIFEARLPNPDIKPTNHANGPTRERFIRDKYERRKYYDAAGFADYAAHASRQPRAPVASGKKQQASVGPPSDAAKQRLEQRRARINHAQSNVVEGEQAFSSASQNRRNKPVIAQAPVSAPPPTMDLLDLMGGGGGDGASEVPPAPASSNNDLFASFVVAEKPAQGTAPAPAAKPASLDIMSLYSSSGAPPQQQMQMQQPNNGFAAFDSLVSGGQQQQQPQNGMGAMNMMQSNMPQNGNSSNMMMNGNNNNMHQMTNMMSNMQFGGAPQQQMYQQGGVGQQPMYQQGGSRYPAGNPQQQQQQMMMMQQQQQRMMMMQQQQRMMQQQQANGFSMGGAAPAMQQPQQQAAAAVTTPEKEDPFAQFATNVFRS